MTKDIPVGVYDDLVNRFTYHPPINDQPDRYKMIRDEFLELALILASNCPQSRELSLALTSLEQASMWANASISRNEKEQVEEK